MAQVGGGREGSSEEVSTRRKGGVCRWIGARLQKRGEAVRNMPGVAGQRAQRKCAGGA